MGVNEMIINGFRSKAQALKHLKAQGHKFDSLLSRTESNPKVAKNGKLGVLSAPLHLAPARLSGFNTCPKASKGCIDACLHTAGNQVYMAQKQKSRIDKTLAYFKHRDAFIALLAFEIAAMERKAKKQKMGVAIRLNATSDLPWELRQMNVDGVDIGLMDYFPNVQFYDYTAVTKRAVAWANGALPKNYHLTFSRKENNDSDVKQVIAAGGNVAIVFAGNPFKHGFSKFQSDAVEKLGGVTLFDGDVSDYRPNDPKGVIVALKAKGDAKNDQSGFVIQK
jgi:hypothetical protein